MEHLSHVVGQIFTAQSLAIIGLLVFLEGVLSIDNALVLAVIAKHLPKEQQKRALTYGLIGAFVFRFIAIGLARYLIHMRWVKFVGGGYLLWLAAKYFFFKVDDESPHGPKAEGAGFWKTVLVIELTDIAFAVDSILAAVALTDKFALIFIGGMIGVIAMRYAATVFIKVLNRFPGFETTAYLLVAVIGFKVVFEGLGIRGVDFHSASNPAFWVFWGLMTGCIAYGFLRRK